MKPLLAAMMDAADGRFPPVDGDFTVLSAPSPGLAAVVSFTGHAIIAANVTREAAVMLDADGYGGALHPRVLTWLAGEGSIGVIDALLVGRGTGRGPKLPRIDAELDHPRVAHARKVRQNVEIFGDERGLVTLAQGLAGRLEISVEATDKGQGQGWGRSLVRDALDHVTDGALVFAAVTPGNARSVRAFLGLGFVPIGSEVLILTGARDPGFR